MSGLQFLKKGVVISAILASVVFSASNTLGDDTTPMSDQHLVDLIKQIDPDTKGEGNSWQFSLENRPIILIFDTIADRMRLMTPVVESADLSAEVQIRVLQANFDSVLDARYAIANDLLWSVFIHPLSPLTENELISAITQVYMAAETFGVTYSSGALTFQGGDSVKEFEKLERELQRRLKPSI